MQFVSWRKVLAVLALILVAGVAGRLLFRSSGTEREVNAAASVIRASAPVETPIREVPVTTREEARLPATSDNLILPNEDSVPLSEPEEYYSAMDPESQPRTTFVEDFRLSESVPPGYLATNLIVTERGFELPQAEGADSPERVGILQSPDLATDFPSNAFAPLWLESLPDGTEVSLEIAFSPDGENWGSWAPVPRSDEDEIDPVYPDGSPNLNFGYSSGPLFGWGEDLWNHFRFRATLSSGVEASPALAGVRVYYQDSTLGEGQTGRMDQVDSILPPSSGEASENQ